MDNARGTETAPVDDPSAIERIEEVGDAGSIPGAFVPSIPRGRKMRERLLARAAAARDAPPSASPTSHPADALDEVGRRRRAEPSFDLDVQTGRAPSAPKRPKRGELSPGMLAAFGSMFGLATVSTLVALAMQAEPSDITAWKLDGTPVPEAKQVKPPPRAPSTSPRPKRQRKRTAAPWRINDAKETQGVRILEGKIGREPFLRAVQNAGIQKKQAYRVLTSLKGLRDLDNCKRTDAFRALIDRASSRVRAFEYIVSAEEVYQAKEGVDGLLRSYKLDLKVQRERVQGALVYTGDRLDTDAEKSGLEPGLAGALAEALEGHMGLGELERGDRIRLIAQEVTVLGEFARYAGIEAVEIKRADPRASLLRVVYFRGPKSRGHFDDHGRAPYEGGWRKPIKGAPVTSPFDLKRLHPILKKVMPHTGVDFGCSAGEAIGASSYGTITFMAWAGASGNLVKIEHAGGYETGYAHLSRFGEDLSVGDKVKRLQLVGYCGSTGRSTGPHLHFSARKDGKFIDPMSLNLDSMRVLPQEERGAFQAARQKYIGELDKIPWPEPLPADPEEEPVAASTSSAADDTSEQAQASAEDGYEGMEAAEEPTASAQKPTPPEAPEVAAAPPKPGAEANAVYLTDKELLEMQSRSDDGEVAE